MADHLIKDWIAEYKGLNEGEVHSFANITIENHDLIQAIITALEEKKYHQELLQPLCEQLFACFRSEEEALHNFTLQFLPSLVCLYLTVSAVGKQKTFGCIEAILLGIYNLEVLDKEGKALVWSFRIPSTSKPSVYHEPFGSSHLALTENALNRLEFGDNRVVNTGPYNEVEKMNASNRLLVMKVLMQVYNRHISLMSRFSHQAVCRAFSRLVRQGTGRQRSSMSLEMGNIPHLQSLPRIPLSADFLLEALHAVYYSMFNGVHFPGNQTMDDIHYRATLELMSEVLLVTNAVRNSLKTNPSGQPADGPMGISLALSPTTSSTVVSKTIITNASFRTKKLPDDIPIQGAKDDGSSGDKPYLAAITEEGDEEHAIRINSVKVKSGSISISGSGKLPVLQLRKNKDKKKDESGKSKKDLETGLKSSLKSTPNYNQQDIKHVTPSGVFNSYNQQDIKQHVTPSGGGGFNKNAEIDFNSDSKMASSLSRLSLDQDLIRGSMVEMNSLHGDSTTSISVVTKKSSSAFNVSGLSGGHIGSTESMMSANGKKDTTETGLSKYPSAQTVV